MALTKIDSDKIKALGIDIDKLIAAIKAPGEVPVDVPDGKFFSEETLKTRDDVIRDEAKKESAKEAFKEGKDKGLEIQGQILLKKFGIDTTNIKAIDPDKVAEAIHGATAKGDSGLQEQVKLLIAERDKVKEDFTAKEKELALKTFDNNLLSSMPVKRNTKLFNDSEFLLTVKSNLEFEEKDGKTLVKERGKDFIRNPDTQAPLTLNEGLDAYFQKRGWIASENQPPEGGRGAGDNLGGTPKGIRSASQFEAEWIKNNPGKTYGQPESVNALKEAAKAAGPGNFDWNS